MQFLEGYFGCRAHTLHGNCTRHDPRARTEAWHGSKSLSAHQCTHPCCHLEFNRMSFPPLSSPRQSTDLLSPPLSEDPSWPLGLSAHLPACPPACLPTCPPACLPTCLPACPPACLPTCPPASQSTLQLRTPLSTHQCRGQASCSDHTARLEHSRGHCLADKWNGRNGALLGRLLPAYPSASAALARTSLRGPRPRLPFGAA